MDRRILLVAALCAGSQMALRISSGCVENGGTCSQFRR